MTDIYLASPGNQAQAEYGVGHDILLSFATWSPFLERYVQAFEKILIDSGAFSVLNSGKSVDVVEYVEWAKQWGDQIEAFAGLDDISGDWKKSLRNYRHGGFPTFHDSDPPELLEDLLEISREQGRNWIGIGLVPPREGKREFIVKTLRRIPDEFHVHGWALRLYGEYRRFDSLDSTNWIRSAMQLRKALHWLTFGECLDIQIKRIVRENRKPKIGLPDETQLELFA